MLCHRDVIDGDPSDPHRAVRPQACSRDRPHSGHDGRKSRIDNQDHQKAGARDRTGLDRPCAIEPGPIG
jgi:hypothetical protein